MYEMTLIDMANVCHGGKLFSLETWMIVLFGIRLLYH